MRLLARGSLALLAAFGWDVLADWKGRAASLTLTIRPGGSMRSSDRSGAAASQRSDGSGGGGGGGDKKRELRVRVVGGETASMILGKLNFFKQDVLPILAARQRVAGGMQAPAPGH